MLSSVPIAQPSFSPACLTCGHLRGRGWGRGCSTGAAGQQLQMTTVNASDVFASAMPPFTIMPNPPPIHPPLHTLSTSQQQLHGAPSMPYMPYYSPAYLPYTPNGLYHLQMYPIAIYYLAKGQAWFFNHFGLRIASGLYLEQNNYWVKRVNIAKGSGVTIKYIIEKGSAAVEAFHEVSHQFAYTFEFVDRARRHKEVDVGQDLRLLTETMLDAQLHVLTGNRPVYVLLKVNKRGDVATGPRVSTIVDLLETGAQALHGGKFKEFIRSTAWDPASGYPVGTPEISSDTNDPLVNGLVFDPVDKNLLVRDRFNDVDDGDTHEQHYLGLGSLGGGLDYLSAFWV
ncbi:hypothetical protein DFH08DRAFT_812588 [Mycena albidolilacea]|uniref:DUF6589 domain-containing protein n=1 Tax=Mycena albidolilacea TaxID=1033008 RepID=A0AAD6ZUR9_9AGAR|nr:hypothetical protein DFH08DRAFT_812588 [Mycena albidolilacea]